MMRGPGLLLLLALAAIPASGITVTGHGGGSTGDEHPSPLLDGVEVFVTDLGAGDTVTVAVNSTKEHESLAWHVVVLCHCEAHRLQITLEGIEGNVTAVLRDEVLLYPAYRRGAVDELGAPGEYRLIVANHGNRTAGLRYQSAIVDTDGGGNDGPPPAIDPRLLVIGLGVAIGAVAVIVGSLRWSGRARKGGRKPPRRRRGGTGRRPGLALLAAAVLTAGGLLVLPLDDPPATVLALGEGTTSRAAPPPEANMTIVTIKAPVQGDLATGRVEVSGVAWVNETLALMNNMTGMYIARVFVSVNFGPFRPATGAEVWNYSWSTPLEQNGKTWVGAVAEDSMGNYTYDWIWVDVENGDHPVATAAAAPARGFPPLAVNFSATGHDPDGRVVGYAWDFRDGNTSTEQNSRHTYVRPGRYEAVVTAEDDRGTQGKAMVVVIVLDPARRPGVLANVTPRPGRDSLTVDAHAISWDDGTIVGHRWDFGDGGSAETQNATHTYCCGGTYAVRLTVTDDDGFTADVQVVVHVTQPPDPPRTFPNMTAPDPFPYSFKGVPGASTHVPPGRTVAHPLPPLRAGEVIWWRYTLCSCSAYDMVVTVEGPKGEHYRPVAINTTVCALAGRNFLAVPSSGVYMVLWTNQGTEELELEYQVAHGPVKKQQEPVSTVRPDGIGLPPVAAVGAVLLAAAAIIVTAAVSRPRSGRA